MYYGHREKCDQEIHAEVIRGKVSRCLPFTKNRFHAEREKAKANVAKSEQLVNSGDGE